MKQTYIIKLLDKNGYTVNFERWSYKKLNTCINRMINLYKELMRYNFVRQELESVVTVVAYKTNELAEEKVWEASKEEFMKMIYA